MISLIYFHLPKISGIQYLVFSLLPPFSILSGFWLHHTKKKKKKTAPIRITIDLSVISPVLTYLTLSIVQPCWQLLPFPFDFCDFTFPWFSVDLPALPFCLLCIFLLCYQYQNSQLFILAHPHFLLCIFSLGWWYSNGTTPGESHWKGLRNIYSGVPLQEIFI